MYNLYMDLDLARLNDWLSNFINFERSPDKNMLNLSTMEKLCDYFGHPEKSCPCFHVAGSKGKGTIAANIAGILSAAGYKVGIYASPHAYHFTERVCSATGPFPADIYYAAEAELKAGVADLIDQVKVSKETLTWFELVTTFAMLVFKKAKVDYTVYEVGMGGRLDTTNIISPKCISVGLIELEHTKYLGDTLAKIAAEKAGVFKPGVPIFSVPQFKEVSEVLDKAAKANSATITYVPAGDYQTVDAEVAKLSVRSVLPETTDNIIKTGLSQVSLPARYEFIQNIPGYTLPFTLIDGAHTANSIRVVVDRMKQDKISGHLLFGYGESGNVEEMAAILIKSNLFKKIYLTVPSVSKKSKLNRTAKAFSSSDKIEIASPDYEKVIEKALNDASSEGVPLIVLGSFYLAREVRKLI